MNAITDKDYIDARLDATVARFTGELKAHELVVTGRLDALRAEFETRFATFESRLIKWVVATVLGGVVLNTSITTALLLSRPPPAPPAPVAPIIVYAQPAPQAAR